MLINLFIECYFVTVVELLKLVINKDFLIIFIEANFTVCK